MLFKCNIFNPVQPCMTFSLKEYFVSYINEYMLHLLGIYCILKYLINSFASTSIRNFFQLNQELQEKS